MTGQPRSARDGLGNLCFYLHLAILALIVFGWLVPWRGFLIIYLVFIPATVLHWKLNNDACILNNLENRLRFGVWRAQERNPEEGAWFRTLVNNTTGVALSPGAMDAIIYAAMALFWGLALVHFLQFQGT